MAVQTPFFGKRDPDAFRPRSAPGGVVPSSGSSGSVPPAGPQGGGMVSSAAPAAQEAGGSRLIVGPNIKLRGVEITDCDTLVVEGTVEATMDSRVIEIAEQGAFHGTAEIDVAEIRGVFDGSLVVRQKLMIYGTGKVRGKIRYGKVVIEEGGELTGQIEVGAAARPSVPVLAAGERLAGATGSSAAPAGLAHAGQAAVTTAVSGVPA